MKLKAELPYTLENKNALNLNYYRIVLIVTGAVYLLWWLIVELLLPNSYNPLGGRLFVLLLLFSIYSGTYVSEFIRKHIDYHFSIAVWVATLHFFYLFYSNRLDIGWVGGCYMLVMTVTALMQTLTGLIGYSILVIVLSVVLDSLSPNLRAILFLPGILTIIGVALASLRVRLKLIAQVNENASQIHRVLEATLEGMNLHDGEFILDCNEAMAKMFGYTREESIGKSIYTMIDRDSAKSVATHVSEQSEVAYEAIGVRKDGSRFPMELRGKKYLLKNGVIGRITSLKDLTERKKNEQIKILFEAAQETLRNRSEFILIASHELKTPLTSIKMQTQMIQMADAKNDPSAYSVDRMKKFVSQIDRQANRLANLIEDMLDVSRISLGKLTLKKEMISLNSLIQDTLADMQELIRQNGNDIICRLESAVTAYVDRFRMEQVLTNLLTNALKYGEGRPITITLAKHGDRVSFSVRDQGMGIAKENQERIFERFERAVNAKKISGLGLGLYISQQIVQAHNGEIIVQSVPNEGACFVVNLPTE